MTETVIHLAGDKPLAVLDEHGWAQGAWTDSGGRVCAHQAIRMCSPVPGDAYLIEALRNLGWHSMADHVQGMQAMIDALAAERDRLLRVADDQHDKHMKALAETARLREALDACAANIEETGEWGMDALAKTRAALTPTTWEPGT